MLRLYTDRLVMGVNRILVLLQLVVRRAQISVVGRYLGVDLYRLSRQTHLLFEVTHLAQCLTLQVQEVASLTLPAQVQPLVASLRQLLPFLEMEVGVGEEEKPLLGAGHGQSELQHLPILFLVFELLDLKSSFLVGLEGHGPAVLKIIQLYVHPTINQYTPQICTLNIKIAESTDHSHQSASTNPSNVATQAAGTTAPPAIYCPSPSTPETTHSIPVNPECVNCSGNSCSAPAQIQMIHTHLSYPLKFACQYICLYCSCVPGQY